MRACLVMAAMSIAAQTAPVFPGELPGDWLKRLRPQHPRLLFSEADWLEVRKRCAEDAASRGWREALKKKGEKTLGEAPVERVLAGPRLLEQSRRALERVTTLAALYRLSGEKKWAERAVKELRAAAAFEDWNPSHFLDVAEMTAAFAFGYDWLYDALSAEEKQLLRAAILAKGLKPGLEAQERAQPPFWVKCAHNWNQVCHGGLTLGALAVAEDQPEIAGKVLRLAGERVPLAMAGFQPDGGWAEGPGYWNYATRYNVFFVAALESAFGSDLGFKQSPGFAETALFRIHSVGPNGLTFNYADAHPKAGNAAQMFWFARAYRRPAFAAHELTLAGQSGSVFHLLWGAGAAKPEEVKALPKDALFRGVNVAFFRSAWGDPRAVYLAFKGGDNQANHSHLDLGVFVLDALGQRWIEDLSSDNYNLPGYFGKERWTYYRLRTEGHNTLTLDGENQNPKAAAPIVAFQSKPERSFAVADLSAAYAPKAKRILRGAALVGRQALVRDEIELNQAAEVVWSAHTPAEAQLDGARAVLSQGGAKLELRILAPEGAKFESLAIPPPPPNGLPVTAGKVGLRFRAERAARVAVLFSPAGEYQPVALEPVERWLAEGKLENVRAGGK